MKRLLLSMTILLTGCQAAMYGTAQDMNAINVGMTKSEVISKLGTPSTTSADASGEQMIYRKMNATIGWTPSNYVVTLKDGKVASFGRRDD